MAIVLNGTSGITTPDIDVTAQSTDFVTSGDLTAAGIYLGGTAAANYLDDYEEGTWTPVDASAAGLSITATNAKYTKIGNMVYVCAEIVYPSNSDGNRVSIGGMPFTISSSSTWGGFNRYTTSNANPTIAAESNTTKADAYERTGSSFTNAALSGKRFDIVVIYSV